VTPVDKLAVASIYLFLLGLAFFLTLTLHRIFRIGVSRKAFATVGAVCEELAEAVAAVLEVSQHRYVAHSGELVN